MATGLAKAKTVQKQSNMLCEMAPCGMFKQSLLNLLVRRFRKISVRLMTTRTSLVSNNFPNGWVNMNLTYVSWNGSGWETRTVTSNFSSCGHLALDSHDNPHIDYLINSHTAIVTP
jgi:hypothetical protein